MFGQQVLLSTQPSSWSQRQWFSKSHTECVNENRNARINWITSISFKKYRINNSHKEMTCASLVKQHAQQEKQTAPDTTATHSALFCWFLSCSLVKRTYWLQHAYWEHTLKVILSSEENPVTCVKHAPALLSVLCMLNASGHALSTLVDPENRLVLTSDFPNHLKVRWIEKPLARWKHSSDLKNYT